METNVDLLLFCDLIQNLSHLSVSVEGRTGACVCRAVLTLNDILGGAQKGSQEVLGPPQASPVLRCVHVDLPLSCAEQMLYGADSPILQGLENGGCL